MTNWPALRARMEQVEPGVRAAVPRAAGGEDQAGPAVGGEFGAAPFAPAVPDYYMTNPIARASAVDGASAAGMLQAAATALSTPAPGGRECMAQTSATSGTRDRSGS